MNLPLFNEAKRIAENRGYTRGLRIGFIVGLVAAMGLLAFAVYSL